jgi:hypothetical protein
MLKRCNDTLQSSDFQFGFKSNHSTEMCIYALKEVINVYVTHASPICVCFIDVKNAFDRVNHYKLYGKLIDRNVPLFIVRFLCMWYEKQVFAIRLGDTWSEWFTVSNGVRQGGVTSPAIFNVYVDDLNTLLLGCAVGCNIGAMFLNNV